MTLRLVALISAVIWGALAVSVAAQGYRVQSGDTLSIEVAEDPSLSREILVPPGGIINFPPVGSIRAGGQTLQQIEVALEAALRPNFTGEPSVFVLLQSLRPPPVILPDETVTVYVTGEMNAPGALEITPHATLLQLVAAAGGPTRFAAMSRVQLRRTDPATGRAHVYQFNVEALLEGRATQPQFRVREGDVLIVPERRLFE